MSAQKYVCITMDNDLMFHRNTVDTPAELPAAEAAVLAAQRGTVQSTFGGQKCC